MSIRSRLLSLVLLATLLPTLFIAWRFMVDREQQIQAATADLTDAADSLAAELNERIQGTVQLHYGLARARDLDTTDRAACSRFLSAVREEHPQYTGILTIDPDGSLFCDSLATGRNLDLRDRKYFKAASSPSGGVALEPVFGRLTGVAVLQIAYPARAPSGALKFVLLASLNLEKFAQDRGMRNVEILLVASDGTVLVWSPAQSRASRKGTSIKDTPLFAFAESHAGGGAGEVAGIDGNPQVWAVAGHAAIRGAGLHVLVGQSQSVLVAAANRRFAEEMLVLALVDIVLIFGVWLLAELGIRRQVVRIAAMARQLGAGDLQARIPPPHPRGELGGLMAVLNGTAESLERQHAAIEDLNQQLRQAQKMEAVGQLTGGIAHDFNNLLTVVLGNADLLVESLSDDPKLKRLAEMVAAAAQRGADLTRSLLAFSRKQTLEPKVTDINALVSQMDGLLRRALGEHIEIEVALAPDLARSTIDPARLEAAILNLAVNARDSMPNGGKLTIATADTELDQDYARQNEGVTPGRYVRIAVSDTGTGMTPEVMAKAFDPFFTTKDVGAGTGLGLSMVYGFIKQSGGHVRIYSEPGHGTVVSLYLPRTAQAGDAEAPAAGQPTAARGGGETILMVEDDAMVRVHVESQLRALGYDVLVAGNGREALEILKRGLPVDLLFTDVVMPGGMNGPQLAAEAVRLRPTLKVLYTSGYAENAIPDRGRLGPGAAMLTKPYQRHELAAKLRVAMGG